MVQVCEQTAGKFVGLSEIDHAGVDIAAWSKFTLGLGKNTKRPYVPDHRFLWRSVVSMRIQAR